MGFDLFVAERDESEHSIVHPDISFARGVLRAGGFPFRRDADFVFEFEHNPLGGIVDNATVSPATTADLNISTGSPLSTASAIFGPTPVT